MARYFPVSHELNNDPEVWELTDEFGDRALFVWLEILAIGDRQRGVLKGTVEGWAKVFMRVYSKGNPRWVRRDSERLLILLRWLSEKGWIEIREGSEAALVIRKYAKYHKLAAEKFLSPNLTKPNLTIKSKKPAPPPVDKSKKNSQIEEVFRVAKQIAGTDSHRCRELCAFVGKTVKEGLKFGDSEEVINDAILYTFNQLKARAVKEGHPIDQGLLWPYLQKTYKFKRTAALQTESDRYKKAPLQSFGQVLDAIGESNGKDKAQA